MATKKKDTTEAAAPAAKKREGMRIIALQVENIKRVKFARITPTEDMIEVVGANGSGKSSVLDAIDYALTGTGHIPTQPIRKGQQSALIQLQIGGDQVEFNVERTFTKVNGGKTDHLSRLTVREPATGKRWESPQTMLDKLLGAISFDPLEFIRMDAKGQFATLRKLITADLEAIEAEKQAAYDRRREAGRDMDAAKGRLAAKKEPSAELPEKPLDTDALTQKLGEAAAHNGEVERARQQKQRLVDGAHNARESAAAIDGKILDLKRQIAELVEQQEAHHENAEALIAQSGEIQVPEAIDTEATMQELKEALATNGAIRDREEYRSIEAQLTEATARWTANDETVKAKDKERAEAIASTKLPIDELSIGESEVVYNGLPFNQASNAEQIRVSVALAIACHPQLRVLRIKDGSLLDKTSLATIREMAKANDYQVWVERVEGDNPVSVVMEEGDATGPQTETNPREAKR